MQNIGGKTGLIYDDRMAEHRCLWVPHPERPARFTGIIDRYKFKMIGKFKTIFISLKEIYF